MSNPDVMPSMEPVGPAPGGSAEPGPLPGSRSLRQDVWLSLRGNWMFWFSVVLISIFVVMAIVPQLFTSIDPNAPGSCQAVRARVSPSSSAWFGYDNQGCDVFALTMYGARASIMVGFLATTFALILGAGIGVYAGFYGGLVDALLSRLTDIFFAIPILLGSIIILVSLPTPQGSAFGSILKVAIAIAALGWTSTARVARSAVIQVKQADFISAARALGASRGWIIRKHIIPNAASPVIVITTLSLGSYIGAEATLSFLGIGLQPPAISWGIAINEASSFVRSTPHMLFFPATFLSLAVLAFIAFGEALQEALDPKAAGKLGKDEGGVALAPADAAVAIDPEVPAVTAEGGKA
jgi:oligopeptide transport system permease protein